MDDFERRIRKLERFNEAAGIPRGRRSAPLRLDSQHQPASMRPRVFPAEDAIILQWPANNPALQ